MRASHAHRIRPRFSCRVDESLNQRVTATAGVVGQDEAELRTRDGRNRKRAFLRPARVADRCADGRVRRCTCPC